MNRSPKLPRGYVVSCIAAVVFVGVTMPVAAAPVQTNFFNDTSDIFYPVSATDLINQGQPTFLNQSSTGFTVSSGSSTANFNNGTLGASLTNADLAWDSDGAWSTTFFLDLTTSPLGYDIANIRSYAGWSTCCYGQYYDLEISVVGDAGFIPLGTYIHDPAPTGSRHSTYIDMYPLNC